MSHACEKLEGLVSFEHRFRETIACLDQYKRDEYMRIYYDERERVVRALVRKGLMQDAKAKRGDPIIADLISCDRCDFLWFVTISLPDEYTVQYILNRQHKLVARKWILEWHWCIEQRSDDPNNFYGFHIHMLFKSTYRKSYVIREIAKHFKVNHSYIDVKVCKDPERVLSYMKGHKEEAKLPRVKVDVKMREHYNIESIYSS